MFRLKMSHHQGFLVYKLPLCSPSSSLFKNLVLRVLLEPWNRATIRLCTVIDGLLWTVVVMYAVEKWPGFVAR
jgi:hypothetical protein